MANRAKQDPGWPVLEWVGPRTPLKGRALVRQQAIHERFVEGLARGWTTHTLEQLARALETIDLRLSEHRRDPVARRGGDVVLAVAAALRSRRRKREVAVALGRAAAIVRRACGLRGYLRPPPGRFGAAAELILDDVAKLLEAGASPERIADEMAEASIVIPSVAEVFPFNGEQRARRVAVLTEAIKDAIEQDRSWRASRDLAGTSADLAEQVVVACTRVAGFRRPSRLFDGLAKRQKRGR